LGSISASSPASSTPVAPPLRQAGDGEVVGPAAERQHQPIPADRPSSGEQAPAWQVETVDLGLNEAGPFGQHVLQRDAYRIGGAGAAGDPGQLGERLVVVVPVDQGQLHHGVVAQLGGQAQGNVQPGVARAGDHDLAAAPGGGCIHDVLHGSASSMDICPSSRRRWLLARRL